VEPTGIISTVAGNGTFGFSGDGGLATGAALFSPFGVAVDGAGNLFIADINNNRIRKVDPSGIIRTVAGNGMFGFSGDGLPASGASLRSPVGVGVDGAGNLFIADTTNKRIRKVDPSGIITTVAGNGTGGFSGDGGPATGASLFPTGVAVDAAGNLFIADEGNNRIRKVDRTGIITNVAGNGSRGFSGDGGPATSASLAQPFGVAVDGAGTLFIAGEGSRIRKVDPTGIISTVAGNGTFGFSGDGGPATGASLGSPTGVAVDGAGNLFIADIDNNRIRKVDRTGIISTVAGNGLCCFSGDGGPATGASLAAPFGVAVDGAGNLFIADSNNQRIRKVDPSGIITTVAGNGTFGFSGDGGPAISASLAFPFGVTADATGNLFIADTENNRVRKVTFDPATLITNLISTVTDLNLQQGIENGLDAKLEAARQALDDLNENNDVAAINALEAFVSFVEAQRGDKIPESDADALIAAAQAIIEILVG
jgi:sugar lactone lactonase YvrE